MTSSYNHAQACKAEGIPYFIWCCEACAERARADFSHGASYPTGGWCQAGKHRTKGETRWVQFDPDFVQPWPSKTPHDLERNYITLPISETAWLDIAYEAAKARYETSPAGIRAIIDREYQAGEISRERFIECVADVLDI